ncbi:MAG: hypothetical protein Q8J76_14250 [Desulfobulbaceae bacterium]|nr:hypothetical protein [Desulfobulbaceae bacterium]
MTVKVAGMWELGWSAPITEYDLWEMVIRDFCVDELYMSPVSGILKQVTEVPDITDAIAANPDLAVVFVDEHADIPLKDFVHPKDALYVFGKATCSAFVVMKRGGDLAVRIETNSKSIGLLWPHQAAAIILYDRLRKSWR